MVFFIFFVPQTVLASIDIQRQFTEALEYLDKSPERSVEILEQLSKETDSIRVKLELARALYFNGQLHASRDVFLLIIESLPENTPSQVYENIESFLSSINKRLNPFRVSISFLRDSNPALSTEAQVIELFGLKFQYNPPEPVREEFGVKVNLDFQLRPSTNTELIGYVSHTQFESSDNSRSFLTPEFRFQISEKRKVWSRLGIEQEYQNGLLLRNGYFLGIRKISYLNSIQSQMLTDFRIVKNEYPDFNMVNGNTYEFSNFAFYRHNSSLRFQLNIGAEHTDAQLDHFRYKTLIFGYGFTMSNLPMRFETTITQTHRYRHYSAEDPFFAIRREDSELSQNLTIRRRGFYVFGVSPSINIVRDERSSNIPIAEYSRVQINLVGEKIF